MPSSPFAHLVPRIARALSIVVVVAMGATACGTSAEDGIGGTVAPQSSPRASVTGTWTGIGPWPVEWSFSSDGTFQKTDLIAPCPEGVTCVWSGIVQNRGSWSVGADRVELRYSNADNFEGTTTPAVLLLTRVGGNVAALVEPGPPSIEFTRR